MTAGETGEPAVSKVRGGAGFSGHREPRRQHGPRSAPGAALHHLDEHAVELVHGLGRGHLAHLEREGLERLAVGADDRAHRAQRVVKAAAREAVEELRRLERRNLHRAEQHRRHLHGRLREAKALQRVGDLGQPDVEPHADGGEIERLGERAHHRDGPVDLVSEILRLPVTAVGELQVDGRVLHHGGGVVAAALERGEIDEGLHQRAHRAVRVERAVEAVVAHVSAADDGDHIAALRRRDHERALERLRAFVLAIEARQLALERVLGLLLGARIEAGVDLEARLGEILVVIVATERAAHEIEVRRVVGAGGPARDPERPPRSGSGLLGLHDALLGHDLEDQVAAGARALGMAPRVVVRGSTDHRDEERHLREVELGERLAEIELAGEPEAVNGAIAVLAEEDLVDVGVHEIRLGEVRIQRHRHDRFANLARERLSRAQEVASHQLLREGAPALLDLPGAHVHPERAQHRNRVDAVMAVELAVLDRFQRRREQCRHLLRRDDDAILAVNREDAADQQRLEPQHRHLLSGAVAQALEPLRARDHAEERGGARLVGEAHRPERHVDALALDAVSPRAVERWGAPVAQALQLLLELCRRECQARVELERRRVHLRRQRPAAPLELVRHQEVEVQHVEGHGERRDPEREQRNPFQFQMKSSTAAGRRLYSELIACP